MQPVANSCVEQIRAADGVSRFRLEDDDQFCDGIKKEQILLIGVAWTLNMKTLSATVS
jgi:hypothetical protein